MHQHPEYPAPDRWLRLREVLFLTGLPRSTLYYRIQKGRFPRPQKKGKFSVWRFSEIERFILASGRYPQSKAVEAQSKWASTEKQFGELT